jgi:hypothetical protein
VASIDQLVHPEKSPQPVDRTGLTVREDTLYSDAKGSEKSSIRNRAEGVLERLGEFLRRLVEPGEAIFYVARAKVMPGTFEQFFLGWLGSVSMPGALLIFTNRRVISLRVRHKGLQNWVWDRGVRVVRWGDLDSVTVKGFISRFLELKLRNGEKVSYWRLSAADTKKIKLLVKALQPGSLAEASNTGAMNSLCPACLTTLVPKQYQCPQCQQQFKTEKSLMWRGFLIPGGACFYVGMVPLGILRLIAESVFLLIILSMLVEAVHPTAGSASPSDSMAGAIVVLVALFLEKALGIVHSRRVVRDFLPAD